eukprot:1597689-Prymnesium_polylepis.2
MRGKDEAGMRAVRIEQLCAGVERRARAHHTTRLALPPLIRVLDVRRAAVLQRVEQRDELPRAVATVGVRERAREDHREAAAHCLGQHTICGPHRDSPHVPPRLQGSALCACRLP